MTCEVDAQVGITTGELLGILGFLLALSKVLWDVLRGMRPRAEVQANFAASRSGIHNLSWLVANVGFRAFTVRKIRLFIKQPEHAEELRTIFDSYETEKHFFLAPGQCESETLIKAVEWLFATHMEVEILPRPWRPIRVALPHAGKHAQHWHKFVRKRLTRAFSDFEVRDEDGGILVGRGDAGIIVSPTGLIIEPNEHIGNHSWAPNGDHSVGDEVITLLHERLPDLFDTPRDGPFGHKYCLWAAEKRILAAKLRKLV